MGSQWRYPATCQTKSTFIFSFYCNSCPIFIMMVTKIIQFHHSTFISQYSAIMSLSFFLGGEPSQVVWGWGGLVSAHSNMVICGPVGWKFSSKFQECDVSQALLVGTTRTYLAELVVGDALGPQPAILVKPCSAKDLISIGSHTHLLATKKPSFFLHPTIYSLLLWT